MTTNRDAMLEKLAALDAEHAKAVAGGGEKYVERHRKRGKLTARERIELLLDEGSAFLELMPLAGWGSDFTVGASVVTGLGVVSGVECMVIANDPTVRGGASNPWTLKKVQRAAQIAPSIRPMKAACRVISSAEGACGRGARYTRSRTAVPAKATTVVSVTVPASSSPICRPPVSST